MAIRGNELTTDPHIVSLFNDCGLPDRRTTVNAAHDHERLQCITSKDGLAIWAHPAIYVPPHEWQNRFRADFDRAVDYFGKFLTQYDALLGIEFNQRCLESRRPEAIALFDSLLESHYRTHTLFVFGNDDSHLTDVAEDAVFTLVLATELTAEAVRQALENGHTFVGQRTETLPESKRITVDPTAATISLELRHANGVVWFVDGEAAAEGLSFDYSDLTDSIVRFQVSVDAVTFYSQAFHVAVRD